jgi:hypothetical protein
MGGQHAWRTGKVGARTRHLQHPVTILSLRLFPGVTDDLRCCVDIGSTLETWFLNCAPGLQHGTSQADAIINFLLILKCQE